MPKRVSIILDDEAATILADRARIPYMKQSSWVSEAIKHAARQEDTERTSLRAKIADLEQQLEALKAEVEKQA